MSLNESSLEKKLSLVTNSQDNIQSLSLWILHHKSQYKRIIQIWYNCLEKAKSAHRLTLFYLANDVIQHAKRKGFPQFVDYFADALKKATILCKDDKKISASIDRVFNIWQERSIYSEDKIQEFRELLSGTSAESAAVSKIVAEFKLSDLIEKIRKTKKAEQSCVSRLESLNNCKVDATSGEVLNKLKDKSHGEQFTRDVDDATKCLESVISALDKEVLIRRDLIENLEKSEIFYETQKDEAKTVVDAYKNFGLRVKNVWRKLEESRNSLPSPLPSPPRDAPSPTNSDDGPNLPMTDGFDPNILLRKVADISDVSHVSHETNAAVSLDQRLSSLMHSMPHMNDASKPNQNNSKNSVIQSSQMATIANNSYVNEGINKNNWIPNPINESNLNVNYLNVNESSYRSQFSSSQFPSVPQNRMPYDFNYPHSMPDYNPQHSSEVQHIQSLVSLREQMAPPVPLSVPTIGPPTALPPFAVDYSLVPPSESTNFESTDMDLGNSDDEDINMSRGPTHRTLKVIDTRRNSRDFGVHPNVPNDRQFNNNNNNLNPISSAINHHNNNNSRPYPQFPVSSPQMKSVARMPVRNAINNVQSSHPYPHSAQWRSPRSAVMVSPQAINTFPPPHQHQPQPQQPPHPRHQHNWRPHNNRNNRKSRY